MYSKAIRKIILCGIRNGIFDYNSLQLVAGTHYDSILKVISKPITSMFDVQAWFLLLGIELGTYGLSTADQLLYDEPRSIVPLTKLAYEQLVNKPVLFYVKYNHKAIISDGENEYVLDSGFYTITCNKNTSIFHNNFVYRYSSSNDDFAIHKIKPKLVIGNADYIPTSADDMVIVPPPASVFISKHHPPLDQNQCILIDECMYYILPLENSRGSYHPFPFHAIQDCSYNNILVKNISKIFTCEWLSDILSSKLFSEITIISPKKLYILKNCILDGLCTIVSTENTIDLTKLIMAAPEIATIIDLHKENLQSI